MTKALRTRASLTLDSGTVLWTDAEDDAIPTYEGMLVKSVVIEKALPDLGAGVQGAREATLEVTNILVTPTLNTPSYLLTLGEILGKQAHVEVTDLEQSPIKTVLDLDGTVIDTPGGIGRTSAQLRISTQDTDGFTSLVPGVAISDAFPSSDHSALRDTKAMVRVPFGIMSKVDLALCHATVLTCTFVIAASADADKYFYADDTSVPDTLTQNGDRLVYDIFLAAAGVLVGLSLWDGTTLLHATAAVDQNGLSSHPATDLSASANARWYRRDIPLPAALIGKTITTFLVGCENNAAGTYVAYIANAAIVDRNGNVRVSIFNENVTPTYNVGTPFLKLPATNTATINKIAIWDFGAIRLPAIINSGPSFSGAGAATYANPDRYNFTTLTAEIWFKVSSATGNPVLMGRTWTGGHGWTLRLNTTAGGLQAAIQTSVGATTSSASGVWTDNVWHHAAFSINVATLTLKVYGDGLLLTTTAYTGTFTTGGGTFSSGAALLTGGAFTGSLSEARIWNRVLDDQEILFHFNALKTGYETGLMGYWPMNENTGSVAADNSPNGNDATLTGHTWVAGPTATQLVPNVINELYRDAGVVPRDQWSPVAWGSFLLAQFLTAPRSPGGRVPAIQADLVSREFSRNPALAAKFMLTDASYGGGKTADTQNFALAAAHYLSLVNPTGYRIDGGLSSLRPLRDVLNELALHGAYYERFSGGAYRMFVDHVNSALSLTAASSQYIAVGDRADLSFTGNIFTIEFWLKANDTTTAMGILRKRTAATAEEYAIWTSVGGTLEFRAWNSNGATVVYQVNTTYDTNWNHFALVADGANCFLYKNGVQVATAAKGGASMSDTVAPFELGRSRDNAGTGITYTNGLLDEVRIWNVARSLTNIIDWKDRELERLETGLVFYMQMNEVGQTSAFDLVTSTWYALLAGATWSTEAAVTWADPKDENGVAVELGDGDYGSTAWQNASYEGEIITALAQRVKTLTLSCAPDPGFTGNLKYVLGPSRSTTVLSATDVGTEVIETNDYIRDFRTADGECQFRLYTAYYGRRLITVTAHRSVRFLRLGQRVKFTAPNWKFVQDRRLLSLIRVEGETLQFGLRGWNAAAYSYTAGANQAPNTALILTDYTQTLPDIPTAFSTGTNTYTISAAGVVTVTVPVTATAPSTANVTALVFKITDASGVPFKTQSIPTLPGGTLAALFDGLPTGTAFYYRVYAFAGLNNASFQEGINAVLGPVTTGATPGAPSAPTSLAGMTKPGQTILTWTNPTNIDLAAIEIHRSTSNSFTDNTTKIDQVAKVGDAAGVSSKYVDSSGVYSTAYFYSVRAKNSCGQVSSFATSVSVTIPQTTTVDRQNMNSTLITGGNLNPYTRRILTFTVSPALSVTPGLSIDVADTPAAHAATLVGPWEQRTNLVSAWQFNADPSVIRNAGDLSLWFWTLTIGIHLTLSLFQHVL